MRRVPAGLPRSRWGSVDVPMVKAAGVGAVCAVAVGWALGQSGGRAPLAVSVSALLAVGVVAVLWLAGRRVARVTGRWTAAAACGVLLAVSAAAAVGLPGVCPTTGGPGRCVAAEVGAWSVAGLVAPVLLVLAVWPWTVAAGMARRAWAAYRR